MTSQERKASTTGTMGAIITFNLDGIDLVGQQDLKWPLVVLQNIDAERMLRDG